MSDVTRDRGGSAPTERAEVRAAGGVVLRPRDDGRPPDVLVVHRPAHQDWSLPKGKLDAGETWQEAAVREVHEETGVTARLGVELAPTRYTDLAGRSKQVRWWTMPVLDDAPRPPDDEVDDLRWVPADEVGALLTYADDRGLVCQALDAVDHAAVLVVRHAHAGDRGAWRSDDGRRPLSERGHRQAAALVDQLAPWHVTRVVASPLVRCVQTMAPLARARGLELITDDRLAEGAAPEDVAALVRASVPGTVLCSHGDVIGALVEGLADDGIVDRAAQQWAKASTWVLRLDGERRTVDAAYLPPPA